MATKVTGKRQSYDAFINSAAWRSQHKKWLQQCNYRCAMFPWLVISKYYKGRYRPYAIHHMNYRNFGGSELLYRDVIPLSPVAHDWVIHGLLSLWLKPGKQRHYPNLFQRLAHGWCVLPLFLKAIVASIVLGGIVATVLDLNFHLGWLELLSQGIPQPLKHLVGVCWNYLVSLFSS